MNLAASLFVLQCESARDINTCRTLMVIAIMISNFSSFANCSRRFLSLLLEKDVADIILGFIEQCGYFIIEK